MRAIARALGVARNSVRKYLRAEEIPKAQPWPKRGSKLDPFRSHLEQRIAEGVVDCVVLLRELRAHGYTGGYSLVKTAVQPLRRPSPVVPTVRFETAPGEQAQADFVAWERAWYGVHWRWAGQRVQVQADQDLVQFFAADPRLAVHPRATQRGQRLIQPGQWAGLPRGDGRPRPEPLAVQLPAVEVEQRSLALYDALPRSTPVGT